MQLTGLDDDGLQKVVDEEREETLGEGLALYGLQLACGKRGGSRDSPGYGT